MSTTVQSILNSPDASRELVRKLVNISTDGLTPFQVAYRGRLVAVNVTPLRRSGNELIKTV